MPQIVEQELKFLGRELEEVSMLTVSMITEIVLSFTAQNAVLLIGFRLRILCGVSAAATWDLATRARFKGTRGVLGSRVQPMLQLGSETTWPIWLRKFARGCLSEKMGRVKCRPHACCLCVLRVYVLIATVYPEVYPSDMLPILARLEPSHVYIRPHYCVLVPYSFGI